MPTIIRALGVAAIAGGVLRVVDSFTMQSFSPTVLAWLYLATDALLLLGIAGIAWSRRAQLDFAGSSGILIFVVGIVLIRIAALGALGSGGYALGATVAVVGLALLAADDLLRRTGRDATASLWLATFVFGVAGTLGLMPVVMMMLAGVAFGAGFIVAGRKVAFS